MYQVKVCSLRSSFRGHRWKTLALTTYINGPIPPAPSNQKLEQWRIQDFSEEGALTPKGGANLLFGQFFPKTAWKRRNFVPQGGAPFRSATVESHFGSGSVPEEDCSISFRSPCPASRRCSTYAAVRYGVCGYRVLHWHTDLNRSDVSVFMCCTTSHSFVHPTLRPSCAQPLYHTKHSAMLRWVITRRDNCLLVRGGEGRTLTVYTIKWSLVFKATSNSCMECSTFPFGWTFIFFRRPP